MSVQGSIFSIFMYLLLCQLFCSEIKKKVSVSNQLDCANVKSDANLLSSLFFFNLSTSLTQLDFLGGFRATTERERETKREIYDDTDMIKVTLP